MWIFTRDSFLSIVRDRTTPDRMLVRAREAGDISRIWPSADVVETPAADYPFRSSIKHEDVSGAIARLVDGIGYTTDFKGGVSDRVRHDAYLRVWQAMRDWQRHRPRPAR